VSATTVKKTLRQEQLGPAGKRRKPTWRAFLRAQAASVIAVDCFTVDTVWLRRLYVLFFIEIGSRGVGVAGCTAHPDAEWFTQQARQRHLDSARDRNRSAFSFGIGTTFMEHYNDHRAHRSLQLAPPDGRPAVSGWSGAQAPAVIRRDRLSGLIHEYQRAA